MRLGKLPVENPQELRVCLDNGKWGWNWDWEMNEGLRLNERGRMNG
jgi:hypothetical protein